MQVIETGKTPRILKFDGPDGYGVEISYMVQSVKNQKAPTVVTARDGVTDLEICEAEEKSVRTGQVVKI